MKCELCQKNDAEIAIQVVRDGNEEELYVCKACAKRERVKRQKKSQRTRKVSGLAPGVSMSITEVSGEDVPPPIIEALMGAMDGIVGEIKKRIEDEEGGEAKSAEEDEAARYHVLPCERTDARFRIGARLHLEGLHLVGELESAQRALHALKMDLRGVNVDCIHETGHVYEFLYTGSTERAKRVAADLLAQERNARARLHGDMARVFGDSLCRALAILKNARLLSPGELFDLLSPLRLAVYDDLLEGITLKEIKRLADTIDLRPRDDMDTSEIDCADAARADEINARFEDVVLNERAEGIFL